MIFGEMIFEMIFPGGSLGVPGGSLGGPWGSLGGAWEVSSWPRMIFRFLGPGCSQCFQNQAN
jgi:hypothetical protein